MSGHVIGFGCARCTLLIETPIVAIYLSADGAPRSELETFDRAVAEPPP